MQRVKAVAATGQLGTGFLEETLAQTAADADFIGCDAGSTDPGPYYLGSGKTQASRAAVKRDTGAILRTALDRGIPALIGSAGTAGGRPHLEWLLGIVRELAQENNWHFTLAGIDSEIDQATLLEAYRGGALRPLDPAPPLDEEGIASAQRFVAMMGIEPFQKALRDGAQVVITGRSSDTSIYAAIPAMRSIPKGIAFHAGKVLECGAASVTHRIYPDSMSAVLDEKGFCIEPPNPAMRCTPQSIASHNLYENADPYRLYEPGGMLDTSGASYEAISDRAVRVTGSDFAPSDEYCVKIEGARLIGYRSVAFAGIRDPLVLRQLDNFISELDAIVAKKVRTSMGVEPDDYTINWRVYGRDGSMGTLEPERNEIGHEVGLMIDIVAPQQEIAGGIASIAWHTGLHHPIPEYSGLISNFAFPFSPPSVDAGPAYAFCANHVLRLDDPCGPFRMTMEDV